MIKANFPQNNTECPFLILVRSSIENISPWINASLSTCVPPHSSRSLEYTDTCYNRYSLKLISHCVQDAVFEHNLQRAKGLIALYDPIVRSAMFNLRNYN